MKKIIGFCILLSWSVQAKPCDVCGSASSASLFSNSLQHRAVGISWNRSVFQSTHLPSLLKENAGKELKSREQFNVVAAFLRWNIRKKGTIFIFLPYQAVGKNSTGQQTSMYGLGDAQVLLTWKVWSKEKKWKQEVHLGGGLKFPTGKFREELISESVSRYMLPGTGSWDPAFQSIYRSQKKNWGVNATVTYMLNGKNRADISWGDRLQLGSDMVYRWKVNKNVSVVPRAGYLVEWAGADKQRDIELPFSGYVLHQLQGGADVQYKKLGLGIMTYIPVAGEIAGGRVQIQQKMMLRIFYIPKQ